MVHQPVHPYRSAEGWVAYHRQIAEAVPELGVVLYVRDRRITGAQLRELGDWCPNVVGVKYAVPDPVRFAAVARDAGLGRFHLDLRPRRAVRPRVLGDGRHRVHLRGW